MDLGGHGGRKYVSCDAFVQKKVVKMNILTASRFIIRHREELWISSSPDLEVEASGASWHIELFCALSMSWLSEHLYDIFSLIIIINSIYQIQ